MSFAVLSQSTLLPLLMPLPLVALPLPRQWRCRQRLCSRHRRPICCRHPLLPPAVSQAGVQVRVLLYSEPQLFLANDSSHAKSVLACHPNIQVVRHVRAACHAFFNYLT